MRKEELISKVVKRQSANPHWSDLTEEDRVIVTVLQDREGEWVVKYLYPNGAISYSHAEEFDFGSDTRNWLTELNELYP